MKKYLTAFFVLLTFSILSAQEKNKEAIETFNKAKDLNYFYALVEDENGDFVVKYYAHDENLDKIAKERADTLAKKHIDVKSYHYFNEYNFNFWSTDIPVDENGKKEFTSDENYIIYASLEWSRIEFNSDQYYNINRKWNEGLQTISDYDIKDLFNVLIHDRVGFAVKKTDTRVYVVAYFQ